MGEVIDLPKKDPTHGCETAEDWVELKLHGHRWVLFVPLPPGSGGAAAAVVKVKYCPWCGVELKTPGKRQS